MPAVVPLSRGRIIAVFVALMVSMFVGSLDQTIVSTALPTIVGELGGVDHMLWVTTAYMLASTVTMPLYGKLGDLDGRKPLFCLALLLFASGSVVCGIGGTMVALIVGRAVQGLGGGGLMVCSQAIVADIFPPKERGKYMGIMGAAFGVSAVVGPLLGGWFTDYAGWRWCFWVNVPLALFALGVVFKFLPLRNASTVARGASRFDVPGTFAMVVATSCLVLALSWGGNTYAWSSPVIMCLIAAFVVCALVFVLVEDRAERCGDGPVIPLRFFRNHNFRFATCAGLLIMVGMMGVVSYMPTYIQITRGHDATVSGYLMVPMMVGMMLASTLSGFLASKLNRIKWMPVASCLVAAVACALLGTLTVGSSTLAMCVYLFLLGFGIGLGQQVLVLIVQNEFPVSEVGTATSANNFFREIGATVGSTVVGSVFTANLAHNLESYTADLGGLSAVGADASSITPVIVRNLGEPLRDAVMNAYNDALTPIYLALVFVLLAAAAMVLMLREKSLAATNDESGRTGRSSVAGERGR